METTANPYAEGEGHATDGLTVGLMQNTSPFEESESSDEESPRSAEREARDPQNPVSLKATRMGEEEGARDNRSMNPNLVVEDEKTRKSRPPNVIELEPRKGEENGRPESPPRRRYGSGDRNRHRFTDYETEQAPPGWTDAQRVVDDRSEDVIRLPPEQSRAPRGWQRLRRVPAPRARQESYRNPPPQRPRSRSGRCGSFVASVLIGLLVIAGWAGLNYAANQRPGAKLFHSYRFQLQDEGLPPAPSIDVTEEELQRGLIDDISLARLAIDLSEYIKEGPYRTCMCMHHLTFLPGKNSEDIPSRRVCVIYNKHRGESEVMINPVATGRSVDTTLFLQKSRGCTKDQLPARVRRPDSIWIEWAEPVLNYKKPPGKRLRKLYAKFSGKDAACLALALEELDGKIKCSPPQQTGKPAAAAPRARPVKTPPAKQRVRISSDYSPPEIRPLSD